MTPYGFFAAAGAVTAIAWLRQHHRAMGLAENEFWAALWLIVGGAVIGAKALFVVLAWPHFAGGELRFWADFGSGFVFFGGLLGAALAGGAFAWWRQLNFWRGADYFGVALPLGHALGRVGCYSQGCCAGHAPHPVQLYEAAGLLLIALLTHRVLRAVQAGRLAHGTAFCGYGLLYGALRLALDPLRIDGRPERFLGLSHQQGIALGLMVAGAAGLVWLRRKSAIK
jgi:phosphatidylglycerol:prolipoprotein diacylglycerol transferase